MRILKGFGALALSACLAMPLVQATAAPTKNPTAAPALADIEDFSKDPAYAKYYSVKPSWSREDCKGASLEFAEDYECDRLTVPKDWKDLSKGELTIAIARKIGAESAGKRLMLSNPGGPGSEGMWFGAKLVPEWITNSTNSHLNIGMDPRGVGASTPIRCKSASSWTYSPESYLADGDSRTFDEAGVRAAAKDRRNFITSCTNENKDLAPYINSLQTARDLNYVRAYLGFATADYYGISYGAWLGGIVSKMYPRSFDRVVTDGNPNWFNTLEGVFNNFDETMQAVYDRSLLPYLASRDDVYHIGKTVKAVNASIEKARTKAKPGNHTASSPNTFDYYIRGGLYGPTGYHNAGAMTAALLGIKEAPKPQPLAELLPKAKVMADDGEESPGYDIAFETLRCADTPNIQDADGWYRKRAPFTKELPLNTSSNLVPACLGWPYKPAVSKEIFERPVGNVLMVNNEADPATGYPDAANIIKKEKGDLKALIVDDLPWHGAPGRQNACANEVITAYLSTGKKPATHVTCQAGPVFGEKYDSATGTVTTYKSPVVYEFFHPGKGSTLPRPYMYFKRDLSQPKLDVEANKPSPKERVAPQRVDVRPLNPLDIEGDRILRESFVRQMGGAPRN